MCLVKTPKVDPNTSRPRDPTVIRNPYLDGVGPTANAARSGRASLRITRGSGGIRPSAPPIAASMPGLPPVAAPPPMSVNPPGSLPVRGGGGYITRGNSMNVW